LSSIQTDENVLPAGLLLAAGALTAASAPPVMHLRRPNAHVTAALDDWRRSGGAAAALPRQRQPGAGGGLSGQLAGTSSFGMSGVNAHVLLAAPESIRNEVTILQCAAYAFAMCCCNSRVSRG
jgi:acyl transferase domain-containing protein